MKLGAIFGIAGAALFCIAGFTGENEFSDYKSWTKANEKPMPMSEIVAKMCVVPSAEQGRSISPDSPHKDYFLTVFVSSLAAKEFMSKKAPDFPVGTRIVKEKLPGEDSKHPELLTAMVKREKGYDSEHGDWEYFVLDGSAAKIQARGKLRSCQSCHDSQRAKGFVFRSYLSKELK